MTRLVLAVASIAALATQAPEKIPDVAFDQFKLANGATAQDQTVYWEQVPSNALEQALFIESDRMGWLLPTLDQAKLDNQRLVVRNERRQNYEMQPYGTSYEALLANLWDPEFPYHWLPIGSHEDLAQATLEDVREFFNHWYGPNNA